MKVTRLTPINPPIVVAAFGAMTWGRHIKPTTIRKNPNTFFIVTQYAPINTPKFGKFTFSLRFCL